MKKIINGKLYDTDTARCLGSDGSNDFRDFHYWHEELYLKRTGEYFLFGEGGPMSRYSRSTGNNSWTGGEAIIPLTAAAAREWAEKHLDADDYADIFGVPSEDEEEAQLHVVIPAQLMAALRARASENGESLTSLVQRILGKSV